MTNVGSLAKLRNSVTRSSDPFSSKSCLKKRAVSMLTPIAAKTIEKLSSWSSWTDLVGFPWPGLTPPLLTRPACRQICAAICWCKIKETRLVKCGVIYTKEGQTSLCGKPAAEKIGIFWPRAIEFIASMVEIPV